MQKLKKMLQFIIVHFNNKKYLTPAISEIAPGLRISVWPKSVALLNQAGPLSAFQNLKLLRWSGAHGGNNVPASIPANY